MLPFTACVSLRDCFANNELLHSPFAAYLIIVADMDESIRFYTEAQGLRLTNRFGNDWATVSADEGLTIGIHPTSTKYPVPGTKGAMMLGLDLDVPVDKAIARLARHGVQIKGSVVFVASLVISRTWKIQTAMRFTCWKSKSGGFGSCVG